MIHAAGAKPSREDIQNAYIRVCKDAGFGLSAVTAAVIAGRVIGVSALEVWIAFSSLDVMRDIACGKHPVCFPLDLPS